MERRPFIRGKVLCLALLLSLVLGLAGVTPGQAVRHADVPAGLQPGEWQSIQNRMRQAEYQFTWHTADGARSQPFEQAPNRAQGWSLVAAAEGLELAPANAEAGWRWRVALQGYGYQALQSPARAPEMRAEAQQVNYRWSATLAEWYRNTPAGLEHGFRLAQRPPGYQAGLPLRLELAVLGGLQAHSVDGGIEFHRAARRLLRYDRLHVYDAGGRELPAGWELAGAATLRMRVDDRDAVYPLTIDLLLASLEAKLRASGAQAFDYFGDAVALSGDLLVVGAPHEDSGGSDAGAAYVFARDQGGANAWGQVKKLAASDAGTLDYFGDSVSISGDTLAIGAPRQDGGGSNAGAVYIFARHQGGANTWGQVKKLAASDAQVDDRFGISVAISGDTLLVGAPCEESAGSYAGAAYIFERDLGGANAWGQVKKLLASDAQATDYFGASVAISGDTLLVGAPYEDSGENNAGAAYVFERDQGGADAWEQVKKLTASGAQADDNFGVSLAISGDILLVGAPAEDAAGNNAGAAYTFKRNLGGANAWGQAQKLFAADAQAEDGFGASVSISGDALLAGAPYEDSGENNAGAAFLFRLTVPDLIFLPLVVK